MSPIIEVPGQGNVEFPDDMGDEDIAKAIRANASPGAQEPPSALSRFLRPFVNVASGLANLPGEAYRAVSGDVRLAGQLIEDPSRIPEVAKATGRAWGRSFAEAAPTAATAIMGGLAAGPGGMVVLPAVERYTRSRIEGKPIEQAYEEGATVGVGAALPLAVSKVGAPLAARITEPGRRLLSLSKKAEFTPALPDVVDAPALSGLMGWASKKLGGGRIRRGAEAELGAVSEYAGREAEALAGPRPISPTAPGEAVQQRLGYLTEKRSERLGGAKERFLERAGATEGTTAERGSQVSQGLKTIQEANKAWDDYLFDAVEQSETGVPTLTISNLARNAGDILKGAERAQSVLERGQTSARLRSTGGKITPTTAATARRFVASEDPQHPLPAAFRELPPETIRSGGAFVTERMIPAPSESLLKTLANLEGQKITVTEAKALKQHLWDALPENQRRFVFKGLMDDMDAWATTSPESDAAAGAYKRARQYHKENVVPFQKGQPLGSMITEGAEPVGIVRSLLTPEDKAIGRLRAVLGQTEGKGPTWEALRSQAVRLATDDPKSFAKLGPETRALIFRQGEEAFIEKFHRLSAEQRPIVQKFLRMQSSEVAPHLLAAGERGLTNLRALKQVIGESPAWGELQGDLLYRMVDNPTAIRKTTPAWRKEVFRPEQQVFLDELDNWSRTSQAKLRARRGEHAATGVNTVLGQQMTEAGGALALTLAGQPKAAFGLATMTLLPNAIARMMTSPRALRWLTEGFRVSATSERAAQVSGAILAEYERARNTQ